MKIQQLTSRLDNRTTVEFSPDSLTIIQENHDDGEHWSGRVQLHRDLVGRLFVEWEQFCAILAAYNYKEEQQ